MSTLAEEYPKEQARVRALLQIYRNLGPVGQFGAMMLERALREADEAAAEQDLVRMVRAFADLKECK